MPETQNLQNHARIHPPYHYVLAPILLIHLLWTLRALVAAPSLDTAEPFLLAIGLFVMGALARIYALKAQDRVIRLEETLRYREVLPGPIAAKAARLKTNQMIALRFASDADLPNLVERIDAGEIVEPKAIKLAISHWRPDYERV
jgi:hypothetical protein